MISNKITFDYREALKGSEKHGVSVSDGGVTMYGSLRAGRYSGWLHQVFPPYCEEVLADFLRENSFLLEFQHPSLWKSFNQSNLFSNCFNIIGPRLSSADGLVHGGIDVIFENVVRSQLGKLHDGLMFSYLSHLSLELIYFENRENKVLIIDRESDEVIVIWDEVHTFLNFHVGFLSSICSPKGEIPEQLDEFYKNFLDESFSNHLCSKPQWG